MKYCPNCGQSLSEDQCPICAQPTRDLEFTPAIEQKYLQDLSNTIWRLFWPVVIVELAVAFVGIYRGQPSLIIIGFGMVAYLFFIRWICRILSKVNNSCTEEKFRGTHRLT